MGTLTDPVPVTGLAANFSPMPRIAPPPLGRDMDGTPGRLESPPVSSDLLTDNDPTALGLALTSCGLTVLLRILRTNGYEGVFTPDNGASIVAPFLFLFICRL